MQLWQAKDHRDRPILFELCERFVLLEQRGAGAYGVVCAAQDRKTEERFAIKKVTKKLTECREAKKVLREVKIMRHLAEVPTIIPIRGIYQSRPRNNSTVGDVYMCMDLMETDLATLIERDRHAAPEDRQISAEVAQEFAHQILLGLHAMHSAGVMHRDLKPHNLLVNSDCTLRICDFGMARDDDADAEKSEYVVTRWYRSPELLMELKEYDKQVDMFSFGCVLGELFTLRVLFPGRSHADQLRRIAQLIGSPTDEDIDNYASTSVREVLRRMDHFEPTNLQEALPNAPPEAVDMLQRLLVYDPKKRLTAMAALEHPFLQDVFDPEEVVDLPKFDSAFERLDKLDDILAELGDEMQRVNGITDFIPLITSTPSPANVAPAEEFVYLKEEAVPNASQDSLVQTSAPTTPQLLAV
eukprot:TRINITY_DN55888_c0_g1_i1.p1 TRINITY_DN55888_c0_g1~~TRINITY_DN55888_c0_g1_i1.p1  ORF type:complete len:413 (-),score=99.99 TRINITY_DN55888_c0_g1_i1:118-1356(-)